MEQALSSKDYDIHMSKKIKREHVMLAQTQGCKILFIS